MLDGRVVNVVSYEITPLELVFPEPLPRAFTVYLLPALAGVALLLLGRAALRHRSARLAATPDSWWAHPASPLLGVGLLPTALSLVDQLAKTEAGPGGWALLPYLAGGVALVCVGLATARLGRDVREPALRPTLERFAPWMVLLAITLWTAVHAAGQHRFWQHFMLGYGDFGFFTVELEQCLPWKEVGPQRFADTGMAYHFMPLFYLLAPLYALFRSPVFLMIVGPLCLSLPALPFYHLARKRTGSALIGLLVAAAWLLLPSVSRLPFANTYGFQAIYPALPFIALAITLAHLGRWRWSCVCLGLALLCKETVCGFGLGWGL